MSRKDDRIEAAAAKVPGGREVKITGHLTINARWQGGRWVPGNVRWTKGYPSVIEGPALVTKVTIDVPESAFASLPVHIDSPEDALTVIEAKVQEADRG